MDEAVTNGDASECLQDPACSSERPVESSECEQFRVVSDYTAQDNDQVHAVLKIQASTNNTPNVFHILDWFTRRRASQRPGEGE